MAGFEGMENLFQNKLFLQFLAGAGADLSAFGADTGKGFQPTNINAITQQNIKAQSAAGAQKKWMEWFQQFLDPSESKATLSNKGITMNLPGSALDDLAPPWDGMGTRGAGGMGTGGAAAVNPFASSLPEFSASDLAGLTPEDISSALAGPLSAVGMKQKLGLEREQLAGKSVQDIFDMMYKGQLMKESEHRVKVGTPTIPIPGTDILLTPAQHLDYQKMTKDDKTAAVKNFEFAQGQGFKGDFMGFQDAARTTHKKDYDEAVAGGYKGSFNTWMLEMAKAGAINLGTKLEEKKAISELEGQLYFNDPKWTGDLSKHLSSEDVQNVVFRSDAPKQARAEETVKFIEDKITAGGGAIQSVKFAEDGKTMVWTVKWPNGDVKEIRYGVKS